MATFPAIVPSFASALQVDASVLEARFGDKYSQRAGNGNNPVSDTWSVIFENYNNTDIETIKTFLRTQAGVDAFDWIPPGEVASKKWTCKSWTVTPSGYNVSTLRATFLQEFDL